MRLAFDAPASFWKKGDVHCGQKCGSVHHANVEHNSLFVCVRMGQFHYVNLELGPKRVNTSWSQRDSSSYRPPGGATGLV